MSSENSDIGVQSINASQQNFARGRLANAFLVSWADPTDMKKPGRLFLASECAEGSNSVRVKGFDTSALIEEVEKNYKQMLESTNKESYKNFSIPWNRIVRIQSLVYRQ